MADTILQKNKDYAEKLKTVLRLRYEPVAVKLVREGESLPDCCKRPEKQMSHCQAVFAAKAGAKSMVKCIRMDKSPKTGAYVFTEQLVEADKAKEYFTKK